MTETVHVKGCCPLDCMDSCAWTVETRDGAVLGVRGERDHPVTRGVLCAKVRDYEARHAAPDRLLTPLKRIGAKGEGRMAAISWDEAIGEIADTFQRIIARHGPEALMPFHYLGSMGVVQRHALLRVFHALGASRAVGNVCGASASALLDEGHPIGVDPEETPKAELVLIWGQNTLSTCHHQWHFIEAARKQRGAKIIVIDPLSTRTARQADLHLAIRPGSDALLAACLARHLFLTGRADLDLARLWAADPEAYRESVLPWTVERTADATGLAPEAIGELAEAYAGARPAQIRAGIAPQQTVAGEDFVRALSALSILGGHWRQLGGGLAILSMPQLDETPASAPELMAGSPRALDMAALGRVLDPAITAPPVMGLMVWCANPALTQIDSNSVKRGLARADLFTVVAEHFMTDTARFADIVLPATMQFEHLDVQGAWGHHYISANRPAIAPRGEARSGGAIMRTLAARLGLDHPKLREGDAEIAQSVLPAGWQLEDLLAAGYRKSPVMRPEIAARTKRLTLCGGPLAAPPPVPAGRLQMLTPKSHYFLNSTFANMPRQQGQQGEPVLAIHPEDARDLGLSTGSLVRINGSEAALTARVKLVAGGRRGIASYEGKWWSEPHAAAEMNALTAPLWSPAGQPAYNTLDVTLTPHEGPAT